MTQSDQPVVVAGVSCLHNRIHIINSDGLDIMPRAFKDQAGCESPAVSRQTVVWLVEYDIGGQSYPIPMDLVIYRSGKIIRRVRSGLMIWSWHFWNHGTQVAFSAGTTHGMDHPVFYELHDLETGRLLARLDGQKAETKLPCWARDLS
jgi:hypothetical protein